MSRTMSLTPTPIAVLKYSVRATSEDGMTHGDILGYVYAVDATEALDKAAKRFEHYPHWRVDCIGAVDL